MAKYIINWAVTGSTFVEGETRREAEAKFDALSITEVYEGADQSDFVVDAILVEMRPGEFDELPEDHCVECRCAECVGEAR